MFFKILVISSNDMHPMRQINCQAIGPKPRPEKVMLFKITVIMRVKTMIRVSLHFALPPFINPDVPTFLFRPCGAITPDLVAHDINIPENPIF